MDAEMNTTTNNTINSTTLGNIKHPFFRKPFTGTTKLDHHSPYQEYTAHMSIAALVLFLLFCLFTIAVFLFSTRNRKCRTSHHLIMTNCMIGHLVAGFIIHPGSIHLNLLYRSVTITTCEFWMFTMWMYACFVSYACITYIVERFIYIQNPPLHEGRLARPLPLLALIALPWMVSMLFALLLLEGTENVIALHVNSTRVWDANQTVRGCFLAVAEEGAPRESSSLQALFMVMLPIIAILTLVITTLTIWCCYKQHATVGTIYYALGERVREDVRNSVIAVSVLGFIGIIAVFGYLIGRMMLPVETLAFGLFGVIQGVVWLSTDRENRETCVMLVKTCCMLRDIEPKGAVHYQPDTDEHGAIEVDA